MLCLVRGNDAHFFAHSHKVSRGCSSHFVHELAAMMTIASLVPISAKFVC